MGWRWVPRVPRLFKFIDDGTIVAKINMHNARVEWENNREIRIKRDLTTEQVFNRTIARAESKGMKVNLAKTAMLLISSANSYNPVGYIQTGGEQLKSKRDKIRILGFYIDGTPSVAAHIEELVSKVKRRLWVLRHSLNLDSPRKNLYRCTVQ